ncbi:MAG: hypothetical protein MKZ67_01900 [Acidimicrobiales bacterium]|nr:hypothetical protein [Acidimicrobiales bacterium]
MPSARILVFVALCTLALGVVTLVRSTVSWSRATRRFCVWLVLVVAVVIGYSATSSAHDPVFLTDDHFAPEIGPFLPDGTISFAMYGRLAEPTSTQGFQARMQQGQSLNLSLLVPAVLPEIGFEIGLLPEVKVTRPDQTSFVLSAQFRETFHEPFTNTTYLRLADHLEEAQQGEYSLLISGRAAGRYVVSIGTLERFGTDIGRYTRPLVVGRSTSPVIEWFETDSGPESNENVESLKKLNDVPEKVTYEPGPEQTRTNQTTSLKASDTGTNWMLFFVAACVVLALAAVAVIRKRKP